jgi:hypothetical protein
VGKRRNMIETGLSSDIFLRRWTLGCHIKLECNMHVEFSRDFSLEHGMAVAKTWSKYDRYVCENLAQHDENVART